MVLHHSGAVATNPSQEIRRHVVQQTHQTMIVKQERVGRLGNQALEKKHHKHERRRRVTGRLRKNMKRSRSRLK